MHNIKKILIVLGLALIPISSDAALVPTSVYRENSQFYIRPLINTDGLIMNASSTINAGLTVRTSTSTSATTTNLSIIGITGSTQCLQVDSSGVVQGTGAACGAAAGSWATTSEAFYWGQNRDWTVQGNASFLAPTTTRGIIVSASSTIVGNFLVTGISTTTNLVVTSSSTLQNFTGLNATTTQATTTNLAISNLTSALIATNATGGTVEYAGTSCTNQFVRSLSALGAATCETVANTDLANSTISGVALGSNLNALTNDTTLNGSSYNGSSAISDWGLNLASANLWTASTTFVGGLSSINSTSTNATSTNLNISGTLDVDGLTSALSLFGATGIAGEYGGSSNPCTNQVPTTISAAGALGGCISINGDWWSGTDLPVAHGGTGLSTFGGTNTVLYTTAADTLASEAAFTYSAGGNLLTTENASTTRFTSSDFTLLATGGANVGIGTTTPNWSLQVASATPYISITDNDTSSGKKHILLSNIDGIFKIGTSTDSLSSTSTALTVDPDGFQSGIGTSSPFARWSIHLSQLDRLQGVSSFAIGSSTASATTTHMRVANTGAIFLPALTTATGGTNQTTCINSTTGELIRETTTVCAVSSGRYKNNVKALEISGLGILGSLNPVSYSMNEDISSDYNDTQYGFIAEEVAKIDPHLVQYGTDGLPRTLDDRAIISVLIKAIKELEERVKLLENEK